MILPKTLSEDLVDEIIWAVFVHFDLFEDYSPLTDDVLGSEDRIQHQIAQDIHGDGKMLIKDLDVEADALLGCECIHVAANRVDLTGYVLGRAAGRSLEQHVLDKMRDAVALGFLMTRTSLYPDSNRRGTDLLHLFGQDREPVRQHLPTYVS